MCDALHATGSDLYYTTVLTQGKPSLFSICVDVSPYDLYKKNKRTFEPLSTDPGLER